MTSHIRNLLRLLLAAALVVAATTLALAQVPPHAPGSICATPQFWCWTDVAGPVGQPCSCATTSGYVAGVYI